MSIVRSAFEYQTTQLLLWAAGEPERLSTRARKLLEDPRHELLFSAASLWEIAIERTLDRDDFQVELRVLHRALLDNRYVELPDTSQHAVHLDALPPLHKRSTEVRTRWEPASER